MKDVTFIGRGIRPGLLLGYGGTDLSQIPAAVAALQRAIAAVPPARARSTA